MLLHESRRAARTCSEGELIALDEQDRAQWDSALIAEGSALVASALSSRRFGVHSLQAAISAVHADAAQSALTDWPEIVGLYDALLRLSPSPVVALNRAAALAFRDGPLVGLTQIDAIMAAGELDDYHLAHAARADMYRRLGRSEDARAAYERALALTQQLPERRFLARRIAQLPKTTT